MSYLMLVSFTLIVVLLLKWIWARHRHMTMLSRYGIPGPKSHFIFGNLMDKPSIIDPNTFNEWFQKYGKVVGFYYGYTPMVIVNDADFYKQVFIKEFNRFPNRMKHFPTWTGDNKEKLSVMLLRDGKWKEMRQILTPAFSSAKLKVMFPLIEAATETILRQIERYSKADKSFNVHKMMNQLVLDIIARIGFGIDAAIQEDQNHPFVRGADTFVSSGSLMFLGFCLPEFNLILTSIRRLLLLFKRLKGEPGLWTLYYLCRKSIEERTSNVALRRNDVLQLMLNTKREAKGENGISPSSGLTLDEIDANAMMFIVAGYEATGSSLSFIVHTLVNNPDIQEKCRNEVLHYMDPKIGGVAYDSLHRLTFLESVMNESMRIYPPTTNFITRAVEDNDFTFNGITIPKGASIMSPTYQFHHDPMLWHEPEKFCPDRFAPENRDSIHAASFQPFGIGPRNCIASRFAMIIMKFTLARILINFKLVPSVETELGRAQIDFTQFDTQPKNGVYLKAIHY